ncbi:MAG: T9SS type A sorting domain-containing protein [Chlorobi bacterium]|nr:T9SS type A sorting domain-containing protein [Chlorobiota bacterium]
MKTFILSVFALFLWLSAVVCSAEIEDDYWVKTYFPDKEVLSFFNVGGNNVFAASTDGEIYEITSSLNGRVVWEKLNIIIDGEINYFGEFKIGTDIGLFYFHPRDSVQEEVILFRGQNVIYCQGPFVLTDQKLYLRGDSGCVECSLPDSNKILKSLSIETDADYAVKRIVGITTSGGLFISKDSCRSWNEVEAFPKDHKFSAVEWSDYLECFFVGSDKGFFVLNDSLIEVPEYDGGSVSCINAMTYYWMDKTDTNEDKLLFTPFNNAAIIIGTSHKGVYEYYNNRIVQKNDSLYDLEITAVHSVWGRGVLAGTKSTGVFCAKHIQGIPGSVPPLNLTPYVLRISPNPAKSRATITFHNPEYAEIEIAIYDLFGRKVADVHSGHLAEGYYNFPADLSGLAAGSYFLKFGVGGRVGSLNLIVE